jgi:transcription-repair coupling factor (superfamily II helicase)
LKNKDFLSLFTHDSLLNTVSERLKNASSSLFLKGFRGSLDAVYAAALCELTECSQLFIMHDREDANFFQSDLANLVQAEVLSFPMSYKKPYELEEVENANVLLRAEVLNKLNSNEAKKYIIVTYPEALPEKVVDKKTLVANTFLAKVGEKIDVEFLAEFLSSYDFERTDFVYEAGQYSVRGGIVDVFSYSNELPYRIELFGDEIETIRTFDPNTQLSVEFRKQVSIIPDMQASKLAIETRENFFKYLKPDTIVWMRDFQKVGDSANRYLQKAEEAYQKRAESGSNLKPSDLFESKDILAKSILSFRKIEFGSHSFLPDSETFELKCRTQPSFNKDFKLIADDLELWRSKNYTLLVSAEQFTQYEKLESIFDEILPQLKLQHLHISLRAGFVDENLKLLCYTDHELFDRFYRYKGKERFSKTKAITLKELRMLQPGDYVVHQDYGIGRFAGMETKEINGQPQEAIRLLYRDDDLLYISVHALHKISKYSGKDGTTVTMSKLGSPEWEEKKKKVSRKVKDIAKELISLYAKRRAAPGFAFSPDTYLQRELETSFLYEDTPDQAKATSDVKLDMEKPHPMDRLVCGDVGFGKTEVAIRAAFKSVSDSKQVAVLVPTTILALQHYKTFKERLKALPCKVDYLNRFKSAAQVKKTLEELASGKIDILIGTHKLIGKDVKFKDLGLLIVDEEQKFGVAVKEKLKELKLNVDTLTLTATPIPRTLHFSMMGARDLSIISTPPPNRQPVTTEVHAFSDVVIRNAVAEELKRNGQVFFVHNRINDLDSIADRIKRLVPDAKVAVAHGQMDGNKLEEVMMGFIEGEYDVLVSTNIVESGLDIPNANTIIINQAHMFGLSDLHQMRGRVGRSNKKAFCYLLTVAPTLLTPEGRKRLATLEEFSELGDGFKVAMRDLDIRGAGDLLGGEQSGFINDIGFETYHKILDETIAELKETEFKDLFKDDLSLLKPLVQDCIIETDLSILIPEKYVTNISERLGLYTELDNIEDEENLNLFVEKVKDRFGPLPDQFWGLIETVRMRWLAEKLGFDKLMLKAKALKAQFVPGDKETYYQSDIFGKILAYVKENGQSSKLAETKGRLVLTVYQIESATAGLELLKKLHGYVFAKEEVKVI